VHSQKISNALSMILSIFHKKVCLQLTPKNVETQCWIAKKTVWQQIPGRRTRNSKTPTTKTVQTIARNDQFLLTGRPKMLTTSNVGRAVGVQLFIRYNGAVPWRHRYISTASLNCTRSVTSSQWSSSCSSHDKPPSNFRVLLTMRAAEFITRWNLSVVTLGDPASTALQ